MTPLDEPTIVNPSNPPEPSKGESEPSAVLLTGGEAAKGLEHTELVVPEKPAPPAAVPDYIRAEVFLENVGFFTPSSKRIGDRFTKEKVVGERVGPDGTKRVIKTKISANAELGLPITSDLDYYRAFLKICDEIVDSAGRFTPPIAVPTRKLLRYAGKLENARERKEVREWFRRMTLTGIIGGMYRAKQKDYDDGFVGTPFSQAILRGEPTKGGTPAETNYIWPAPWWLSNFYYRHTRHIDYSFHQRLRKPIAKALVSLLETGWYASDGHPYAKRYADLCDEFLLAKYHHLSKIKEQLDPAHRELQREHFLSSWEYRKAADNVAYVITYYPGEKFRQDQRARTERRELAQGIRQGGRGEAAAPSLPTATRDLTDREAYLVNEMITQAGLGEHSRGYCLKLVRTLPEEAIFGLISETKQAALEYRITTTKPRYFTDLAQRALGKRPTGFAS